MKLQKMTDFVLEQRMSSNEVSDSSIYDIQTHIYSYYDKVFAYATFLRQPLTLGMFFPADEEGNVLEEPSDYDYYVSDNEQYFNGDVDECKKYVEAKEKVLFEGFEFPSEEWYKGTKTILHKKLDMLLYLDSNQISINGPLGIGYGEVKTVEDLTNYELELTPSALKQIGIIEK